MALLSKDQILKADDLKTEPVEVPEWGGEVLVRTLMGEERDKFEADSVTINKKGQPQQNLANMRARLVALCAVNEAGERLFSAYDVPDLGRKSATALDRVFQKAQELNGFTEADIEELAEGFGDGRDAPSTSA
ncbi:hypothetical protein ACIRPT_02600 [Streptomyces sp. NPDC101227]|uniref:hypothetical protein n=1 Tax=Streptomyces sp. NPDC101227 TaxID=3366136 RepID=UPI0037FA2CE3